MFLLFAAAVAVQPVADVGYTQLMRGEENEAIAVIGADQAGHDLVKRINLAIAYARRGENDLARAHFQTVIDRREITELQTSTGEWVDARTIARRGIAMLDRGAFTSAGQLAQR